MKDDYTIDKLQEANSKVEKLTALLEAAFYSANNPNGMHTEEFMAKWFSNYLEMWANIKL